MNGLALSNYIYESLLLEALEGHKAQRAEFIINKLGSFWKPLPGYETIDQFVEKVAEVDPSLKGIYMPWIARLAITKPNENRAEDLNRLSDDLRAFETFKAKIANKDINQYKNFSDLYDVIALFLAPRKKTKDELEGEKKEAKLQKIKGEIITVYAGPEGWIRIPTTKKASQFLGQGTRWCTAATNNCMFDHYAKDDVMFIIYDKETKARTQLHINSGQLAKEDDKNIGIDSTPAWARKPIVDHYKKNNPQLTLKQMMSLSKFTDENLAAGSDHEDLLALMKQYGVWL